MVKKKIIELDNKFPKFTLDEFRRFCDSIVDQMENPEKYQKDCNHKWDYDLQDKTKMCEFCGKEEPNEKYNNG